MKVKKIKTIKYLYILLIFFELFILFFKFCNNVNAKENDSCNYNLNAKAGYVIDINNSQVLFSKNSNKSLPIASITKLLTIYVVLNQINKRKISLNQKVSPTKFLSNLSSNNQIANVPLKMHYLYTLNELYQASLVHSANAAVMLLAQSVFGSQKKAVFMMRKQLKLWNIKNATIYNTCGLNNRYLDNHFYPGSPINGENKMSAKDIAIISFHLIHKFPKIFNTSKLSFLKFPNGNGGYLKENTWNLMLPGHQYYDKNLNVNGLKTGTSNDAGDCFVCTTKLKNGNILLSVVLHANGNNNLGKRFIVTKQLLSYILSNWHENNVIVANKKNNVIKKITINNGKKKIINVVPKQNINVFIFKNQYYNLRFKQQKFDYLNAPISKGESVGTIGIIPNNNIDFLFKNMSPKVELISTENDAKINWLSSLIMKIRHLFKDVLILYR